MSDDQQKLVFRMQHLVPRNLSSAAQQHASAPPATDVIGPEEVEFPMTYGKVAGKIWGPADGKPVLAIHGWLDNCASFDALIPLLPKDLRIVSVDIPGHGFSSAFPPDIAYNYIDTLLAVERLTRQLGWTGKFSFLAHSLGGATASLYAGVFPERVDKLVLLDIIRATPTRPDTVDVRLRKTVGKLLKYEAAILAGPEKPFSYEEAIERSVSGSFGSLDENACHILFKRGLKKVQPDGGYVFSRDRRLMAAPLSFIPKEDQLILARKTTAAVLMIKFADGPYFEDPADYAEHMEALKTSSRKVIYAEVPGKHHVHLTNPASIAPMISDFFNNA